LDDAAFAVAGGAVITCAYASGGGCLAAAGSMSVVLSDAGSTIATAKAIRKKAGWRDPEWRDAAVSWATTFAGGKKGDLAGGVIGAVISFGQRVYDWWSNQ